MGASIKSFLRLPPFQPLWRVLLSVSASGLRVANDPRNQAFAARYQTRFLRRLGFGGGSSIESGGERLALESLRQRLPGQPVVFDVGANRGDYLKTILSVLPAARVFCFEPSAAAFALLSKAVPPGSKVELCNFGFSDIETQMTLYADREASGLASVYRRRLDHMGLIMEPRGVIQLKTLDQFCAAKGIDHIDLLKIDTEGHELKVFEGGRAMLQRGAISCIQFEFGGCNIDSRTYFQDFWYLLKDHYQLYRELPDGLLPVSKYREEDEVFVTANYLAILKQKLPPLTPGPPA